nr:hypothetical protein [Macrococcus goetzii]
METVLNVIKNDREYIKELESELHEANRYIKALEKKLIELGVDDPIHDVEII